MSIQNNDLKDLIQTTFSVDQYKSKVGDDKNIVVIAFDIKDGDPAKDLSQFIETGHDTIDVDVSPGPDADGLYKVFVELERNSKLFDSIDNVLRDVTRADNSAFGFKFNSYKQDSTLDWNKENFDERVYSSSYDYTIATNPEAHVIAERMKFLNSYKRK
jgi:hypothetical protein